MMHLVVFFFAINCAHPENSAEQNVCARPELKAKDQDIERQTAALKQKLTGENAAILADTEMPFLRQLNDCSNESEVRPCVEKVLAQRADLLSRAQQSADAIRQAIAQAYYIDIGFLWKYWKLLLDRKLSVFGCLSLDDDASRTKATLETENQPSVPVRFKSMTDQIADFLDDQKPCAHWLVTVHKDSDTFVLNADEVLGRPLP